MRSNKSKQSGLTLVELLVVISTMTLLAALGMPRFKEMKRTSMQAEPKMMLNQILAIQEAYRANNDVYVHNITVACPGTPETCNNRIAITRTGETYYDATATETGCLLPNNNNPANNNYHIARLGFRVTDCRKLRYFYATNGYYHVAREIGTNYNNDDRRVFAGCTDRFDTWVLTNTKEWRHSGRLNTDQNYLTTMNGYDANFMCQN